jgi:hypothetical protein
MTKSRQQSNPHGPATPVPVEVQLLIFDLIGTGLRGPKRHQTYLYIRRGFPEENVKLEELID